MARRKRNRRQLYRRIFIATEGRDDLSLVTWLVDLSRDRRTNLAFDKRPLNGGSILTLVNAALVQRTERQKGRSSAEKFIRSGLLLDRDRRREDGRFAEEAEILARREGLELFYQDPCYEASLVRLHAQQCNRNFQNSGNAKAELARCWPEMAETRPTARQIGQRFCLDDINRMADLDGEIARLLRFFGLR